LGYSPYILVPNDPALAGLHTPETRTLNNPDVPSPYPPGAQLLFRAVTAISESTFARKGSARQVVVKYGSEGGYTPGDTWELYVGPNNRVEEFIYHRGGPKKPSVVITTWSGYKKAGPLLISTDHRGTADGKPARIFFTNVSVKLTGTETWMNAQ